MESITRPFVIPPQSIQLILKQLCPKHWTDLISLLWIAIGIGLYLLHGITWDRKDPNQYIYFERPQQKNESIDYQLQSKRNIAEKMKEADKKLVVFWGSQSGTAERFASQLSKECQLRFSLNSMTANLSDYDPISITQLPSDILVIFILATYGEGDPSDNANEFLEWLNKPLNVALSNIHYAAFGLGNSNYRYYNRVVDIFVDLLNKHGAISALMTGKADDATNSTTEDFLSWKDDLFQMFRKDLCLKEHQSEYQPTISIIEDQSLCLTDIPDGKPYQIRNTPKSMAACSPINAIGIKNIKDIFTSRDRNCVHMELDLTDTEMHYKTGDHLGIWPINPDEAVDCLLNILDLSDRQNIPIALSSLESKIKTNLPSPTTPALLFRYYLEICAPISRDIAFGLASFAPTTEARSFILNLVQNKQIYADFLAHTHLTFGKLLTLASSGQSWSKLPLSYVIESLPIRHPRYYSISSSSVLSPRRPTITALVSNETNPGFPAQRIYGVTSNYLLSYLQPYSATQNLTYDLNGPNGLLKGSKLFAHIRKSKFKLPLSSSTPIIMIAAGTGLAPFRAFITERAKLHSIGRNVGQMVLFFGCRHPDEDFIYHEELEKIQLSLDPGMLRILTAFSRASKEKKVYVQDRVVEHGEEIIKLIEDGANLYICGRASMARDVGRKISEMVQKTRGWNQKETKLWSEELKRKGKWREDVWG